MGFPGRDIIVRPENGRLVPATPSSVEAVRQLAQGELYMVRVVQQRHLGHHRKFFSLVGWVAANHPTFDTTAKALDAIKLAAGHVDWFAHPVTGEVIPIPRSIAFDRLTQEDFDTFYADAVAAVLEHLAPDVDDPHAFAAEVAKY